MSDLANRCFSLVLNSAWQPIGYKNTIDALCGLYSGKFKGLNIEYKNGQTESMDPLSWDQWKDLKISQNDYFVSTGDKEIKIPTVLIAVNFSKTLYKRTPLNLHNIRIRDKNICQYTGRKLKTEEGSIDHVVPKCKGGKNSWDNLVFCDKKINSKKGDKTKEEVGLKLIKNPKEPPLMPLVTNIPIKHKDWGIFLIKKRQITNIQ